VKGKKLPEPWHEPRDVTSLSDPEEKEEEEEEEEKEEKLQERSRRQVRGSPRAMVLEDHGILEVLEDHGIPLVLDDHGIPEVLENRGVLEVLKDHSIPVVPGDHCIPASTIMALLSPLPVAAVTAGGQTSAGGSCDGTGWAEGSGTVGAASGCHWLAEGTELGDSLAVPSSSTIGLGAPFVGSPSPQGLHCLWG